VIFLEFSRQTVCDAMDKNAVARHVFGRHMSAGVAYWQPQTARCDGLENALCTGTEDDD